MKLSVGEIILLIVGVIVVAPVVVALLTPTTDALSMGLLWLGAVAVFLIAFFVVRRLTRKG